MKLNLALFTLAILMMACESAQNTSVETEKTQPMETKYADDTHSFSKPNDVAVTHISLDLMVSFEDRIISGTVVYNIERNTQGDLILDTDGLTITAARDAATNKELQFSLNEGDDYGNELVIELNDETKKVAVDYSTSPDAAALLWMDPEQTNDGKAPFLFTQGQAILTRSWIPIQDSPAVRVTYDAKVTVPSGMMALMSAENPTEMNEDGVYEFKMDKPIPPYLMALAVGDLAFESLGEHTGVYAEPGMLAASAYEFADMEKMLLAAEELYGPYSWGRYDVLVLPPGFPFGGMENPKLTFATPTIIAGDRSLTSLIAHELAHSWSGNLVTNATWDDFWLNEGFTVYFEKRIMESLYGESYASMLNELGYQDLQHTLAELGEESPDTHLKLNLDGRNPDDGMTDIAYEKGYLFLRWLESIVGRERFDAFLKNYFEKNAFHTMTTESFIEYLNANLLNELDEKPDLDQWIYSSGLPADHLVPESTRFDAVDSARVAWMDGATSTEELPTAEWSTHEWLHFLRGIPENVGKERLADLDQAFNLTDSKNSEITAVWFEKAIENDYQVAFPQLEMFLMKVGRRKFLKPLYTKLAETPEHKIWAEKVYAKARGNYHAVSVNTIDEILGWQKS
ncbi:M1 family metallopeptidase [Cryomorphaceae bacterium 1068]|nr:M1 family metallopeptidase [Cryomorphaceae bacterium 1068]